MLIFLDSETLIESERVDSIGLIYVRPEDSDKDMYQVCIEVVVNGENYHVDRNDVVLENKDGIFCPKLTTAFRSLMLVNAKKINEWEGFNDERNIQ